MVIVFKYQTKLLEYIFVLNSTAQISKVSWQDVQE